MRLTGLIITALLAITAGIITISTPHAAAPGGLHAFSASVGGHGDHVHSSMEMGQGSQSMVHHHASAQADCDPPISGSHKGPGTDCCNMGACHAVQIFPAPMIHSPFGSVVAVIMEGDEQVEGIISGSLDRPPRTI